MRNGMADDHELENHYHHSRPHVAGSSHQGGEWRQVGMDSVAHPHGCTHAGDLFVEKEAIDLVVCQVRLPE